MIRVTAILLWVALVLAVKIGFDAGAAALGFIAEGVKRLRRRIRQRRIRKKAASWYEEHGGAPDEVLESFNADEVRMKTWLQSRTIHGLLASGVAAVLGWFLLDPDAGTLGAQIAEWLLQGAQIGGLIYAARGRKLAEGPLA